MQITQEALEAAFAPIKEISGGELTFDVGGIPVTLRLLVPEEETEVQRYAFQSEAGGDESVMALEYLEKFRVALLSHAVVAVGEMDLRGVKFVETGDRLDTGVAVKVPRYMAMRKIVAEWGGPLRVAVFTKYTELSASVEKKAEAAVKFEPSDPDAEVERLEKRIRDIKEGKDKDKARSAFVKTANLVQEADVARRQDEDEASGKAVPPPAPVAPPAAAPRKPIYPQQAVPPEPAPREAQRPASAPQEAPRAEPLPDVTDSLVDDGDMEAAVAAENRRLMENRIRNGEPLPPAPEGALTAGTRMAAPIPQGVVDAAPAIRMRPPEELSQQPAVPRPAPRPAAESNNPRFKRPAPGK